VPPVVSQARDRPHPMADDRQVANYG